MPTHWSAQAGLNRIMSNQISRAAASAVSDRAAEPGGVGLQPRRPDDAGAEQPAGGEQGLGEDRPLDQAAGDEILALGKAERLLEPDIERARRRTGRRAAGSAQRARDGSGGRARRSAASSTAGSASE